MHVILLVLGLLTTVAGGAMIGFGIQYNEFGLGNTLIEAGTTATVGGLILIGVAATVRQIKQLNRVLAAARQVGEPQQSPPRQIARSEPVPQRPLPQRPLPQRPPGPAAHPESAELASEISELKTLAEAPTRPAGPGFGAASADAVERPVPPRTEALAAGGQERSAEAIQRRERLSSAVAPKIASEQADAGVPSGEPSAPDLALEPAPSVPIRPARAPQAVTILKSGVIEGMAYTLYSDGSIEAELRQGTLRFGSIGELREYLSKQG
jgi:hypothetical protein